MIGSSEKAIDLPQQIEALALSAELAHGRLDEEQVAFARHVVDKAEARLRHGTTNTLVALLGATGSGKSSVTNALVGSEVATAGIRRPTTSSTLACFWGEQDAQPLLDWLEVKNRHQVAIGPGSLELDGLVLLDVPDHDSVAVEHRLEMERIAEHADMLLWVTDAEKYADKAMHEYLERLDGHGAVTAMILNKSDQLSEADLNSCRTDLQRLLALDGIEQAPVVALSALTGHGVDELRTLLVEAVGRQQAMVDRLAADARMAADGLATELGSADLSSKALDKRLDRAAKTLSTELVGASGLATVCEAVAAGHRRDAAQATGWPFTRWVRKLRPHPLRKLHLGEGSGGRASLPQASGVQVARSEAAVRQANANVTEDLPNPWPDLIRTAGTPDQQQLNDRLDGAISDSVRTSQDAKPRWWRMVNVLQTVLALATVAGAVWLGLLALAAYLQIPELPTPEVRRIPVPTGMLIGGIVLGLLVAFVAARLAALGADRRSRAVRKKAEQAVSNVSDELVIQPMKHELDQREELLELLTTAGGGA